VVLSETEQKKKRNKKDRYSKGVETMYRNAYRVQLDLISLAATKANIMISLNGFIVSVLLVSGSVIYARDPGFIVPLGIFLLTSAVSIYFAFLSASPKAPARRKRLRSCLFELLRGKITLQQFNEIRNQPKTHFDRENSNILIFEDYATVPKAIYLDCMDELIHSPEKLYQKMSDQLYYLGQVADKKYNLLRYSYNIFRWGVIVSTLAFLLIKALHYYFPEVSEANSGLSGNIQQYQFDGIYEPSGIQALPDGRFVVVEDEAKDALHVMALNQQNQMVEDKRLSRQLMRSFYQPLDDLEAVTLGPDGYLYAMTSFSLNKHGERSPEREQFIRFKIDGNHITGAYSYSNLRQFIEQSGILGEVDEQGNGGIVNINIEALSFDRQGRLLIGFRTPLSGDKTILGVLQNPQAVFDHREKPNILRQPLLIDLHGGGIRAMTYSDILKGYLISNEVYGLGDNRKKHSQLLYWDGNPVHRVYHMIQSGLENIEGITDVRQDGVTKLLLVSDNGRKDKNKVASYHLLDYRELSR
jgi:hypothetical protein